MASSSPPPLPRRRLTLRVLLAVAVIATAIAARLAHDRAARRVVQLETEARINFEHGKPEEAERQLLVALGQAPGSPRAIALLAAVRTSLGRGDEAERELREALARAPAEPVIAVALASTLAARGHGDEAWDLLGPRLPALAATRDPMERAQLLVAAAQVATTRGATADAERVLRDAAEPRPGESAPAARAHVLKALGRLLATSGRLAEADAVLAEAQTAVTSDISTVTQRALVLEQLGRREDAIALLQGAPIQSSGSQRLDAYSTLADLLVRAGRFRDARLLATSIGQDPDLFALASYVTGSVSFAMADYKDAEAAFGRLATAFPASSWPHLVRARAALLSGSVDQARSELGAAERLRPGAPDTGLGLLRLDELAGRGEAVFSRALDLLSDRSARGGALRALAVSALRPARQAAIRARLEALLAGHPEDPWLRFFTAIFRLLEREATGAAELESVARAGPELERAFAPQSRLDLASIDRLEVLEWTALLARREPLLVPGRAALATVCLRLGRRDLAALSLESVAVSGSQPHARPALLLWAELVSSDRDAARAAELLDQVARDAPDAAVLAALAGLRHRLGDSEAARKLLADAAERAPDDAVLRGRLGLLRAVHGDMDAALVAFERARHLAPSDFVANLDGAVQLARGDLAGAESALRRALEATGDPRFGAALAATLALEGKLGAAIEANAASRAKMPPTPEALLVDVMVLALAGDARAAEAAAHAPVPEEVKKAALAVTRERAGPSLAIFAFGLLGWSPGHVARLERAAALPDADALAAWWAARAVRPDDPPALRVALAKRLAELAPSAPGPGLDLAAAQLAAGDARAAVLTGKALLERSPGDSTIELRLGMLHEAASETNEALVCYEHVHARAPSAIALNNMAWLLARDRAPTAINYARDAVRLDPNLGEGCDTLGWLVFQAGKLEEAELLLERAAALIPESPGVRFRLALLFQARGENARALHHVTIALRSPRRFADIEKARTLAERLASEEKR